MAPAAIIIDTGLSSPQRQVCSCTRCPSDTVEPLKRQERMELRREAERVARDDNVHARQHKLKGGALALRTTDFQSGAPWPANPPS